MIGFRTENRNRNYHAKRKLSDIYRKRRQILRQLRKKKKGSVKCYIAGVFSTKLVPNPIVASNKLNTTFCSDDDVKHFILCNKPTLVNFLVKALYFFCRMYVYIESPFSTMKIIDKIIVNGFFTIIDKIIVNG